MVESVSAADRCELRALSRDVVVIVCDTGARLRSSPKLETLTGPAPAPLTSLRLPLANGGTRAMWAFRKPADRDLVMRAFVGVLSQSQLIEVRAADEYPQLDLSAISADLDPKGRQSLISALFGVWAPAFKLRHGQPFIRAARKMLSTIMPNPAPASIEAALPDGRALLRMAIPQDLGDVQCIYVISATGIDPQTRHWQTDALGRRGKRRLHLTARGDLNERDCIVIVGSQGIAIRRPIAKQAVPSLGGWWRTQARTGDQLREFIVRALSGTPVSGAAAALEFQLRWPLKPKSLSGRNWLPSASVEVALAGPSGLLVAGRFRDPARLVSHLEVEDEGGALHRIAWHLFAGPPEQDGKASTQTGFVGFSPTYRNDLPILQPRFRLQLASGSAHRLVPRVQPLDPVERRGLALATVPPQHLSDALMAECLAPALGDLQRAVRAKARPPHTVRIGDLPENPKTSVIVPLYRNLEFLQTQIAAFAVDPVFAEDAELIYVLDSPEQAAEVEQYLRGLDLLYRVPVALVVMAENAGYAAACNAGAAVARGAFLAMLNSDVIPSAPGWLDILTGRMIASPEIAACGPKLLFEDGAIQHAGLYFAQNHFGRWLNHHFYKGMPRHYAPAIVERLVPAVTGACLVVRSDAFNLVKGFSEDYVIGDYEDSDLCLKLRAAGHEIAYIPGAELYHLERQSIRQHDDYMRGCADRYNAWLHAARWGETIRALMLLPVEAPEMRSAA